MADTKITALTALTAADPANDVIPIVDVSDTTMAASGTTKKISVNNILGASGTATLASATITGDLTVDTSTLKVDSTNNRVGIVNATPSFTLDVNGAGSSMCARISSGSGTGLRFDTTRNVSGLNRNYLIGPDILNEGWFAIIPSTALGGGTFTNSIYNASSDGIHSWSNGAGGELMRLNTTGNLVLKGGTLAANGVGVTFPATQVASSDANCLDDYEEGTWVPTVGGTSTYTANQKASYIKVGRLVTVSWDMEILLIGTGSTTTISGLPFVVGSATSPKFEQCNGAAGYFGSLAVNVYSLTFNASANTSTITSISMNTLGGTANVNPAIYGNGTRVQGTVTYMAA